MSIKGMTVQDLMNTVNTADVIVTFPGECRISSGDKTVFVFTDARGNITHLSTDYIEGIGFNRVEIKDSLKNMLYAAIHARKYKLYGMHSVRPQSRTK